MTDEPCPPCDCGAPCAYVPAFEHWTGCPYKIGFFGAPVGWGVGEGGEVREAAGIKYRFGSPGTWHPVFEDAK